jgi:hypothetical protein
MLTLHFGGLNAILFIGQLPIFGWFSCWISTQGLDLALRYQYVYRHRETWKQKSPSSAEVVKAGEEHFRIRNFFFTGDADGLSLSPSLSLKMMLSIVAKLLHFWDTWHVGTAVWFCGSALSRWCWIRLKASTTSTATSRNCQAKVHVSATFVLVRAVVFPWMKPKLAPNVRHVLNNSSSPT